MIIGIDAHMLGDHSGGNESYYTNILTNMEANNKDDIIVFVKENTDVSFLPLNFKVICFKCKNAFIRNFIEIPILCKKYNLDILHMQYFIPFYRPCPIAASIHDICFEHYNNIFKRTEYLRLKILVPYAARKSKIIFASSKYSKDDICKQYHINKDKVYITYDAVDSSFRRLNWKELDEVNLRKKYNIGNNKFILTVGNLQPRKNLPRLINAFTSYLTKEKNRTKLVIVGKKAWMYNKIFQSAIEKAENIIFTDYVTKNDLIRLYNAAAGFIYPSFFEGFGLPPLEAMACGTPVAVSNVSSLPEVVGNAGIYFDPFSEKEIETAIKDLLEEGEDRTRMIKRGLEQVKRFSWKKTADIILDAYQHI